MLLPVFCNLLTPYCTVPLSPCKERLISFNDDDDDGDVLQGSGRLKMAVRLRNNRLQVFYPRSRFPGQPLQVVEMKSVPVFDGEWHTVVLSVTADSVATRTDCRKRKQRRMRRPFPTLIDIRFDEVLIATCGRRASERFRVRNFASNLIYCNKEALQGGSKSKLLIFSEYVK